MNTNYTFYKQSSEEKVAAILTAELIDDIILHVFTKRDRNIEVITYRGGDIKIDTEGRKLWAEITNTPSGKWVGFNPGINIDVPNAVNAIKNNLDDNDLLILSAYFN